MDGKSEAAAAAATAAAASSSPSPGTTGQRNPHSLLTRDLVASCIRADKGEDAILQTFEVKDFTAKGDNYMSVVTSICARYRQDDAYLEANYVVKINPQSPSPVLGAVIRELFLKEGGFYKEICPALNRELRLAGLDELRVARAPLVHLEAGEEVIFMEDLRKRGYRMADRGKGLDDDHSLLVVKELARFHAASVLLRKKLGVDLLEKFPFLAEAHSEAYGPFFAALLEGTALFADKVGGQGHVVQYLRGKLQPKFMEYYFEQLQSEEPFIAITHGDCWTNNMLFRYDAESRPVEVMLVDLQVVRRSSASTDLSYMMYTSLNGEDRRRTLDMFLYCYFTIFQEVLSAGGMEPLFTFQKLLEDYKAHRLHGILMGLLMVPALLREEGQAFDMKSITEENLEEMMKENQQEVVNLSENPKVKERFLSLFEDLTEMELL
ncbi:uncharacterized protein LOC143041397 [Oratosquilla oratoria]|uniref:uncharacterized protein LOC143041397 n=1 Tax=Oratosquilla oratoria TaxID=337810 RepID=UPI003F774283